LKEDISLRVVGDNCFVKYSGVYYSVPYTFCKQKVILRVSKSEVIICDINGAYIASHERDGSTKYVTDPTHMPPQNTPRDSQIYNSEKYVEWAGHIGSNTRSVIECLLTGYKYEQQAFKTCMAILQLSKKYGNIRLESACKMAMFLGCINYYSIKRMLVQGADLKPLPAKTPAYNNKYTQLRLDTGNNL
jgi:hypothetical protein